MSAGTPQRNKRQAQAQRQAYMNSLRLEASNIQKNYNANEIYKATGTAAIPKATENPTERGSSMEGRKQLIKESLVSTGIMNSFVADNFLADLSDDDLTFFLSHQQAILEGFKPKNVPAAVFKAYFKKYQNKFGETLGIEYGLQQGSGGDFAMDAALMMKAITENREALEAFKEEISAKFDKETASKYKAQADSLLSKMPTQAEFDQIQRLDEEQRQEAYEELSGLLGNLPDFENLLAVARLRGIDQDSELFSDAEKSIQRNKELEALADMRFALADSEQELRRGRFDLKDLLRKAREREEEIEGILTGQSDYDKLVEDTRQRQDEIDTSLALGDLLRQTKDKASAIQDFSKGGLPVDEDELFDLGQKLGVDQEILDSGDEDLIRTAIQRALVESDAGVGVEYETLSPELPLEGFFLLPEEFQQLFEKVDIPDPDAFFRRPADVRRKIIQSLERSLQENGGPEEVFPIESEGVFVNAKDLLIRPAEVQRDTLRVMTPLVRPRPRGRAKSPSTRRDLTGAEARARRSSEDTVGGVPPAGTASQMASTLGAGMRGRGLSRSKPKTPVEKSDGYEKPVQYTQFGRYLIHHPKLKQGILQLKTPKGGAIKALPTEYLTPRLKETMLTLVGNGSPTLEQFDRLTADEKEKLHHITKHSQYEKVSIPRGHMDKEDQMVHKFTILKGELLAGNNSKQLLKEFKSMLIKFVEEGRIPRRQANEILIELAREGM